MKYLLLFTVVLVFTASSCQRNPQKTLTIQVSLLHIPDSIQTVYLEEMEPNRTLIVDSQSIVKSNVSLTLQSTTNGQEGLYQLAFRNGSRILLGLSSGTYHLAGDYGHLDAVQISGGKTPEEVHTFLAEVTRRSNTIVQAQLQLDTLSPMPDQDSLRAIYELQLYSNRTDLLSYVLHFARHTSSPAGAVFALSLLNNQFEWEHGKQIQDSLLLRFPGNSLIQSIVQDTATESGKTAPSSVTALKIGDIAPDLTYPDPTGTLHDLRAYRGNYVLVDFWASWCAPCRKENPNLCKAVATFGKKNFKIYGVSLDTKLSSWKTAILQDSITWSQVSDLKGWNSKPAATYGVEGIPANFLLDPNGRIIAEDIRGKALQETLGKLLHN